ncbi:MAG: DUF4390 domain-containing protein [Desulfatiglandaceae bacterium]
MAIFLCLALFSGEAFGDSRNAAIEDIVVTNTRDNLLVYFTVTNCLTDEIIEAIENGISTSFLFFIKLYEKKGLWPDREIESLTITHEIKYDNLRKVYTVRRFNGEENITSTADFHEAGKLMSEIVGMKLVDLDSLDKGKKYRVSIMAQLDKVELPFALHQIFFFVKLWDFKTPWYNMEFIY